jgi:hypothetical protein
MPLDASRLKLLESGNPSRTSLVTRPSFSLEFSGLRAIQGSLVTRPSFPLAKMSSKFPDCSEQSKEGLVTKLFMDDSPKSEIFYQCSSASRALGTRDKVSISLPNTSKIKMGYLIT